MPLRSVPEKNLKAILYAFLAAILYAINIPASKILLRDVGPTTMAALLYLGAGIGIAGLSLFNAKDRRASAPLSRKDLPYVIGMIVLDIAAPIFSHARNTARLVGQRLVARQF